MENNFSGWEKLGESCIIIVGINIAVLLAEPEQVNQLLSRYCPHFVSISLLEDEVDGHLGNGHFKGLQVHHGCQRG